MDGFEGGEVDPFKSLSISRSANGEVSRRRRDGGVLVLSTYPSVSRFATATSPFVRRKNGEDLLAETCDLTQTPRPKRVWQQV
jgi:hypothetical protein